MIIHMTTVHPRDDSRIRHKEIPTLKKELNDEVELFVQDGLGDEFDDIKDDYDIDMNGDSHAAANGDEHEEIELESAEIRQDRNVKGRDEDIDTGNDIVEEIEEVEDNGDRE